MADETETSTAETETDATAADADKGQDTKADDTAAADEAASTKGQDKKAPEAKKDNGADAGDTKDAAVDWRAGIQDQKLRDLAGRYTTPEDLAKAALDLRQKLSNAIVLPGKNATDEEIAAYRKRIGVPEGDYTWEMPEGHEETDNDKAFQADVSKVFKELDISEHQAKGLNALWNKTLGDLEAHAAKIEDDWQAEQDAALRKEWGADYEPNAAIAVATWEKFGGTQALEDLRLKDGGRVGDHPAMMRMMASIGRLTSESPGLLGMSTNERRSMEERHSELVAKSIEAGGKGRHDEQKKLSREADDLAEKIWGTGPVPGSGRAA